jgi:predicted dehydrogenase
MKKDLRIGIAGAGLIGAKRAEAIRKTKSGTLIAVADVDHKRAKALAEKYGVEAVPAWQTLIARKDLNVIVVAVPNAFAKPIVLAALRNGKHVLCEKPFGVSSKESKAMVAAAKKARRIVKVGFNHRFHASLMKAHEICVNGGIGKVLFIRARYGHGGRKGMEKEWRFNKKISGGGELLDQGVHIIDLARWFAGEPTTAYGLMETKFWNTKLDDNTFVLMKNKKATVSFHVSTTNWKNLFSFEVFGELGFLLIDGKGGSYGEEVLTYGKRLPEFGGAPIQKVFRFGANDESWEREWKYFAETVRHGKKIMSNVGDGLRANQIIEAIYLSSRTHKEVKIKLT